MVSDLVDDATTIAREELAAAQGLGHGPGPRGVMAGGGRDGENGARGGQIALDGTQDDSDGEDDEDDDDYDGILAEEGEVADDLAAALEAALGQRRAGELLGAPGGGGGGGGGGAMGRAHMGAQIDPEIAAALADHPELLEEALAA